VFDSFGVTLKDVVPRGLTSSSMSGSAAEETLWVRSNSFNHDLTFNYNFSPGKGALRQC
jgi:hypothetical protein